MNQVLLGELAPILYVAAESVLFAFLSRSLSMFSANYGSVPEPKEQLITLKGLKRQQLL